MLVVKTPNQESLPDGSIVQLKPGARVVPQFSNEVRRVILLEGTAHFRVVPSSRPFVVIAAGVTAEALGTQFSVELSGPIVSVLVNEGRVAVNRESTREAVGVDATVEKPLAVLDAGNAVRVSVKAAGDDRTSAIEYVPVKEVEDRLAWRIPRLEFSGTPLSEVVAMINQYNSQQLVIADRALEPLALSGIVRADKVDALLALLRSEFKVRSEQVGETVVLRSAQ
jgi:transmembrane sensor